MHSSHINRNTVAMIFRSLRGRFGTAFVDKFRSGKTVPLGQPDAGKDTGLLEAMDVWAHELRDLTQAEVQHGLTCKFKYPPSADEFVLACCQRDCSGLPQNQLRALPPSPLTPAERDAAAKHLARVQELARGKMAAEPGIRLGWALAIAKDATGGGKVGFYVGRMAAEALRNSRQQVPDSLMAFLPKEAQL